MKDTYFNRIEKVKNGQLVTLEQAKAQLNVDTSFNDDDVIISQLIDAATGIAEDFTGVDLLNTTNTLEGFNWSGDRLRIREGNIIEVNSITITKDGVDSAIDTYDVEKRRTDFTIRFEDNIEADKIVITFTTGFASVPKQVEQAILIKVNDLYDIERTSYTIGTQFKDTNAFERLLRAFVINRW